MRKQIDNSGIKINTKKIEEFMSDNCYSKAAFARRCRISTWLLDKILSGKTNFRFTAIINIAEVMQVPSSALVLAD